MYNENANRGKFLGAMKSPSTKPNMLQPFRIVDGNSDAQKAMGSVHASYPVKNISK